MVALEVGSHIDIDYVAILQESFVWDAVTYDLHAQRGTAQLLCWAPHLKKAALRHGFCKQSKGHVPLAKTCRGTVLPSPCPSSGDLCPGTELTCQSMKGMDCAAPLSPHLRTCTPIWGS